MGHSCFFSFLLSFCNFPVKISDALSQDKAIRFRHTQNQMHVPLGQFSGTYSLKTKKECPPRVLHPPAVCPQA